MVASTTTFMSLVLFQQSFLLKITRHFFASRLNEAPALTDVNVFLKIQNGVLMGFLSPGVTKLGLHSDTSAYVFGPRTKRPIQPKRICGFPWQWYAAHYWLCWLLDCSAYSLIVPPLFCSNNDIKKIKFPNSELPGEAAPRQAWLWSTCWGKVSQGAGTPPLRPGSPSSYQMGGLRATRHRRLRSSKTQGWSCLPWAFATPGMTDGWKNKVHCQ